MEIIPRIHPVDGVNGNCDILVRDELTVIDTGLTGSGKKILNYITEKVHREPSEIKAIIITHFHMDPVGIREYLVEGINPPEKKIHVIFFYQIIALPDNLSLVVYNICTPVVSVRMHCQKNQEREGQ
jgi:glyoxylase-like metal-dependent hydrolase (beta-lactamase superfamily II)